MSGQSILTKRRNLRAAGLLLGVVLCLSAGLQPAIGKAASRPRAMGGAETAARPDPDAMLIEVYKDLAANQLNKAQAKADALVDAYPNFHLAQLIRGDLLLMHTQTVDTFGAVKTGAQDKLKDLREEAIARLRSLRERPDPNLVPSALIKLREDQKYALVVDAKRSRLYVYENRQGVPKFVDDYYVSQGKLGVDKLKEGDQKTPLGVYYITARLPRERLPDFYGAGALPISYPNEWDKLHGRGGSGIWLHGTPSDSYSRPPLASDGCVVLTNPDLYKLSASVEVGKTPVIISDQVQFVTRDKWEAERMDANRLVEGWRAALESLDANRLRANYSARFKTERGENADAWLSKQQHWMKGIRNLSIHLRDVSFFLYPGQENLLVGTFTQEATIGKSRHSVRKRQYWAKEGTQWKIVAESAWDS